MFVQQNLALKQQEKILFQEGDVNDNQCFVCSQGGTLACCDFCFRAYHSKCKPLHRDFNGQYRCECCRQQRPCEFCNQLTLQDKTRILCTICKQPAHLNCNIKMNHLINSDYFDSFLLREQTYVCRACLKTRGVRKVHIIKRQTYEYNHQTNEDMVALVQINHPSPVHYGWFLQQDVRQIFKLQTISPFQNHVYPDQCEQIERIIAMRVPSIHEKKYFEGIVQILLDPERVSHVVFGGCNNFHFLVKWSSFQHENLMWEDEVIVRQFSGGKQSLVKYLKSKQFQLSPTASNKFAFIYEFYRKEHTYLVERNNDLSFERMAKQRCIYPVEFIALKNMEHGIRQMCYLFNQIFILEGQQWPVLVIAPRESLHLWKGQLRKYCPYLESLMFAGSYKSIDIIKKTYFCKRSSKNNPSRSHFQIMLVEEEAFVQHQSFILNSLEMISVLVFANFQGQELLRCYSNCHIKIKKMIKHHILLADKSKFVNQKYEKSLFAKIDMFFGSEYILKHDMSKRNMEVLQPILPRVSQAAIDSQIPTDNRFFKHARLSELKRVCFLRYVLQFGVQMQDNFNLYQKLHIFAPQVFDSLSVKSKLTMRSYLTAFLSLLGSYSENKPEPTVLQYYLFQCDIDQVVERIIQIESLRLTIKNKKSLGWINFEVYDENQIEKLGEIKNWGIEDDIVLANLILIQGFGCWQRIYDNKIWTKFDPRKSGRKDGLGLAFGTYLKLKMMTVIRRANIDALTIIAQRAQKILSSDRDII